MQAIVSSHRIPAKSSLLLAAFGVPRQSPARFKCVYTGITCLLNSAVSSLKLGLVLLALAVGFSAFESFWPGLIEKWCFDYGLTLSYQVGYQLACRMRIRGQMECWGSYNLVIKDLPGETRQFWFEPLGLGELLPPLGVSFSFSSSVIISFSFSFFFFNHPI